MLFSLIIKFLCFLEKINFKHFQKADREFTASILSLNFNFKRALELHEDLVEGGQSPAELIMGCFDGIKVYIYPLFCFDLWMLGYVSQFAAWYYFKYHLSLSHKNTT